MQNTELEAEDVLINIVGATTDVIGRAAIVASDFPKSNITQAMSLLRIQDKESIDPYYLFSFLAGKYGNQQVRRIARPTGQYNLNLIEVGTFKIPVLLGDFQLHLRKLVNQSQKLIEQSKNIYKQAEELLLSELGLKDWQPIEDTIAVKRFSDSWGGCDRGDAEHYKPRYDQILDELNKLKPEKIAHLKELLITITNGQTPLRHDLGIGEVKFLTAEHIDDFRINYNTEKRVTLQHHATELTRTHLVKGDVLLTIKGKVGNAAVVDNLDELVNINQDVALIRLVADIHPYYIAGFINSVAGKLLIQQTCTGQINPFLSLGNLRKVKIPLFKAELMNELGNAIQAKVESARHAAYQSKQLLEIAKTGVERAIEEDEERAIAWMNQQLEVLNIEFNA
ncbi:hypothetical protein [Phormidesmis sp. 146-33]